MYKSENEHVGLTIFTIMTTLKKALKRARLFEVQKLTRRIRSVEKRR
jgi:hypothetical protein